ncbi:haloacid dehalogenase-like hydrolase domain protein, partial [Staphylococcus lugdunensis VCU139]
IVDDAWDYAANVNANNTIYTRLDPHKLAELRQLDEITHPIKVIFLNIKSHHFSEIAQHLMQHQTTLELINHSNESNIDITAHGINKYKTLQSILKMMHPILHLVMITMILDYCNMLLMVYLYLIIHFI